MHGERRKEAGQQHNQGELKAKNNQQQEKESAFNDEEERTNKCRNREVKNREESENDKSEQELKKVQGQDSEQIDLNAITDKKGATSIFPQSIPAQFSDPTSFQFLHPSIPLDSHSLPFSQQSSSPSSSSTSQHRSQFQQQREQQQQQQPAQQQMTNNSDKQVLQGQQQLSPNKDDDNDDESLFMANSNFLRDVTETPPVTMINQQQEEEKYYQQQNQQNREISDDYRGNQKRLNQNKDTKGGITDDYAKEMTNQLKRALIREGAFKKFIPERLDEDEDQKQSTEKPQKEDQEKEQQNGEDSVFSISENIKMMLLTDENTQINDNSQENGLKNQNQRSNRIKPEKNQRSSRRGQENLLMRMTLKIVETLQQCNTKFNYQPVYMNPKRDLTQPSEGVLNNGYDNVDSDYILRVADFIISPEGKEYEILDMLGKGTFGQVVKCECKQTKEMAAIKVIKNKKAFKNQGVVEIKILDILNRVYDPSGDNPLVRMIDFFVFRDHLCIVFELLSASIYDLLKENMFQGLSLNFSRLIISQILEAMKVVKDAKLIHCDLKPENILFKSKENPNIKIIDFGSACFEGFAIFQYIQSRYYRSPEVLLGLPYDAAIDMWSLGCICAELFLGIPIFPGNSEYDQLQRIIEILGPIPQYLIHRAKYRDKYFFYQPQIGLYRFKSIEEFQNSTGIRIDPPRRYIENFYSLDDMKNLFLAKKQKEQQAAQQQNATNQKRVQSLVVLESEMNAMDAFIDFLKGVLRIDKDQRWTPLMAMGHPFITRETFVAPYDPKREQDRISTHDTGEDSLSERSSSSKDSKEYKAGSCPSRILYPQNASVPQYMQYQNANPNPQLQPQFGKHFSNKQSNQVELQNQNITGLEGNQNQGNAFPEFVFYAGRNQQYVESHRPPILSIPDDFFKGFMFGRLDQILSMTREQLFQFIYEQKEIQFKQHAQRVMMIQQQQQQAQYQNHLMQQHQQQMIMNQQQMGYQQHIQNPNFQYSNPNIQGPINPQHIGSHPQNQFQFQNQQFGGPPSGQRGYQNYNQNQSQGIPPGQLQGFNQQIYGQINQGFIPTPQEFIVPSEQIIYNPPPYMQQKQQLHISAAQMNDPQYQRMIMQQHHRKMMAQNQSNGVNRGKAGSWHAPAALQAHKYNQYYNQINNPGQLIGRQDPNFYVNQPHQMDFDSQHFFQQQFYPVPLGLQPNVSQQKQQDFANQQQVQDQSNGIPQASPKTQLSGKQFFKIDITKQNTSENKRHIFGSSRHNLGLGSNETISQTIIEEEKEKQPDIKHRETQEQQIPFPDNRLMGVAPQHFYQQQHQIIGLGSLPKKLSTESLQINDPWNLPKLRQEQSILNFEQTPPQAKRQLSGQYGTSHSQSSQYLIDQQYQSLMHQNSIPIQRSQHSQFTAPNYHTGLYNQHSSMHGTPKFNQQHQRLQNVSSQTSLSGIPNYGNPSALFPPESSKLNSSFTSIHSNSSSTGTQGGNQQKTLGHSSSRGFLNKLQQNQQQNYSINQSSSKQNLNEHQTFQKQFFNKSRQHLERQESSGQMVPEKAFSTSSSQDSQKLRQGSEQYEDNQFEGKDQYFVNQQPLNQPQNNPWMAPIKSTHQVPIKLDQPLQRLIKGQQPGSLTFEQIVQQKMIQQPQVIPSQTIESKVFGVTNYQITHKGQSNNPQLDLLYSSYQQTSFNVQETLQKDDSQLSIFEKQPQIFPSKHQYSPRRTAIIQNPQPASLINPGSHLKITQRQPSNHGSIAKNLTPIDENRFIEDDQNFGVNLQTHNQHQQNYVLQQQHHNYLDNGSSSGSDEHTSKFRKRSFDEEEEEEDYQDDQQQEYDPYELRDKMRAQTFNNQDETSSQSSSVSQKRKYKFRDDLEDEY